MLPSKKKKSEKICTPYHHFSEKQPLDTRQATRDRRQTSQIKNGEKL